MLSVFSIKKSVKFSFIFYINFIKYYYFNSLECFIELFLLFILSLSNAYNISNTPFNY